MNTDVFSLFNITSLLSVYLNYLKQFSVTSGLDLKASVERAETLETDYTAQETAEHPFDFNVIGNTFCHVTDTIRRWLTSFGDPLEFTELQIHICKTFLVILCVNLLLIGFYWRKYGGIITDRFIRPSTAKEIEELKLSVARLKLPKEHSPRI